MLSSLISRLNGVLLAGHHDTLVVGDSHVAFAGRHRLRVDATFMGVPGACVRSTWRRLQRGEFRFVTCDTLIVVLGENVIAPWCPPERAAADVYQLALKLGDAVHATRIVLHGVFADQPAFNRALAAHGDQADVFYLAAPRATFLPDGVHLTETDYRGWGMFLRYMLGLSGRPAKTLPRWLWRVIDTTVRLKQRYA